MPDHFFLSYSKLDGRDYAVHLADSLAPPFAAWLDERELRAASDDWDDQVVAAIQDAKALIFLMTLDSVQSLSVCKAEWVRALQYKKPIILLRFNDDAEAPFRLGSRQFIDFSASFDDGLASLRKDLQWLDSPKGQLRQLQYRLADAQRELPRAKPEKQPRIKADLADLQQQIASLQAVIANPAAASQRVDENIQRGLQAVREPPPPPAPAAPTRFINPPPAIAPTWFQNRHVESGIVGDFLKDGALRLLTIVGRGGMGKTAMVCRLLKSVENGRLPDDQGPFSVDAILYLSNARSFHRVTVPELYAGLVQLVPPETAARLDAVYKNPQSTARATMEALLAAFADSRTVILLDNFEDALDDQSGNIKDAELAEALRALLELPLQGFKVILTTRAIPLDLADIEPGRQRRLDLDHGLESPYAEDVLRAMDPDGTLGLRDAPAALLGEARARTRGNPRALEHLKGILAADPDTTLKEILEDTKRLLPDKVLEVLVGEAFNRLDPAFQRVMQALATYRYPVPAAAVDYLLQPYVPGVDSAPILKRLVNMQFARGDAKRYYLHQVDRDYALSRLPEGAPGDGKLTPPPLSRFALNHRGADWFKQSRKAAADWKTLDDLAPQLSEYELRLAAQEYDDAALVLLEIDFNYLILWGHFRLTAELHARLQGHIADPALAGASASNLGTAYWRMGQYQPALDATERSLTLARDRKDRASEAGCLVSLGAIYADLGRSAEAIDCYEQARAIWRELKLPGNESYALGNLANQYVIIGQTAKAIEYHLKALALYDDSPDPQGRALVLANLGNDYNHLGDYTEALRRLDQSYSLATAIGYRLIELGALAIMGYVYLDLGQLPKSIDKFCQAVDLADGSGNNQFQNEARSGLALAHLYAGDLPKAREVADAARQHDFPLGNFRAAMVAGLVAFRQGDASAPGTLTAAITQARDLLSRNPSLFDAFDVQGLSFAALALCENIKHLPEAREAFQSARALNSAPGIVHRVTQILDALAKADKTGILADLRPIATGSPKQ